ncbi:heterodisulfide reductase, subunit B [Marssonina coronariae]|uniref:Heterodisulfide reductase, subunit B n=1 Tax=Diplocarpon coronariae TaxID=2795749 RepID=A0A218YXV8_9HELO|nr:heterodisulfide reductase, subunit B [Marssonina coronariae]
MARASSTTGSTSAFALPRPGAYASTKSAFSGQTLPALVPPRNPALHVKFGLAAATVSGHRNLNHSISQLLTAPCQPAPGGTGTPKPLTQPTSPSPLQIFVVV